MLLQLRILITIEHDKNLSTEMDSPNQQLQDHRTGVTGT